MILWFLLQLFVTVFNNTSFINKRIYFEVGNNYQLELNVSNINVVKWDPLKKKNGMEDCALIPLNRLPKNKVTH